MDAPRGLFIESFGVPLICESLRDFRIIPALVSIEKCKLGKKMTANEEPWLAPKRLKRNAASALQISRFFVVRLLFGCHIPSWLWGDYLGR
jgi:hypothetical protein